MGYIKHHTIVVVGYDQEKVAEGRQKAIDIFTGTYFDHYGDPGGKLVSDVIKGLANETYSFFIAPDGSKEGWETSQLGDDARERFIKWLDEDGWLEYVEVLFGGDDSFTEVTEHSRTMD